MSISTASNPASAHPSSHGPTIARRSVSLLRRGHVEGVLVGPLRVDDGVAVAVPQQEVGVVVEPEPGLVGLGLEPVHVAHRVPVRIGCFGAVAHHDADVGVGRVGPAELVVEPGARRRQRHRGRGGGIVATALPDHQQRDGHEQARQERQAAHP